MLLALTRAVSPRIEQCELTHLARTPIDYARAVEEHDAYEALLTRLGCRVERVPDAPDLPDSVFVEDAAVVFDRIAVIARPGAQSRRPEVAAMETALRRYRTLARIEPPGTLDGGDVLVTPGTVFVGVGGRTNVDGVRQLTAHVAPHGFEVVPVHVRECLHLKSAVTAVALAPPAGKSALVINPAWVDSAHFAAFDLIDVDPAEPAAANVLLINSTVICPAEHPRTRRLIEARGFVTESVPAFELAKAEGGLTCCAVLVAI